MSLTIPWFFQRLIFITDSIESLIRRLTYRVFRWNRSESTIVEYGDVLESWEIMKRRWKQISIIILRRTNILIKVCSFEFHGVSCWVDVNYCEILWRYDNGSSILFVAVKVKMMAGAAVRTTILSPERIRDVGDSSAIVRVIDVSTTWIIVNRLRLWLWWLRLRVGLMWKKSGYYYY